MKIRTYIYYLLLNCLILPVSAAVGDIFTYKGVQYQVTKETGDSYEVSAVQYDSVYIVLADSVSCGLQRYAVTSAITWYNFNNCPLRYYKKVDMSAARSITRLATQSSGQVAVDTLILPPNLQFFPYYFGTTDSLDHRIHLTDLDNLLPGIHRIYSTGNQALSNLNLSGCTSLLEADVSSYTTSHGMYSFCQSNPFLQILKVPNTITLFGRGAFDGNYRLTELSIPDSLMRIDGPIASDIAMTILKFGKRVEVVAPEFAEAWYKLQKLEVDPDNAHFMAQNGVLFSKNQHVLWHFPYSWLGQEYYLPLATYNIGSYAFAYVADFNKREQQSQIISITPLKRLIFHSAINEIQDYAFFGSSITHYVDFDKTQIRKISHSCFQRSAIESITLPETITDIDIRAFGETPYLQNLSTSFSRNIHSIGQEAFYDAWKLEQLDFFTCDYLTDIPYSMCLRDSSLSYIALPRNVQTIGARAFEGCVSLQEIICPSLIPFAIEASVFEGVNKQQCRLIVPSCSVNQYKTASVWKDFLNIESGRLCYLATNVSDSLAGSVRGGGVYMQGEKVTVRACPNEGFEFVRWSDGETKETRLINMVKDITLVAEFAPKTELSIEMAISVSDSSGRKVIDKGQFYLIREGKKYTSTGVEVR